MRGHCATSDRQVNFFFPKVQGGCNTPVFAMLLRFIKALVLAARHTEKAPPITALVSGVLVMCRLRKRVEPKILNKRLDTCRQCPVYVPDTETCGKAGQPTGCWCFMPVKAMMPEATCWLRDQNPNEKDDGYGWRREISG